MTTRTNLDFASFPKRIHLRRGLAFGIIIIGALIAFEAFNYSTTEFALTDLLGDLSFMGIAWATILAIAFCGIDFAGIARLFTPEEGDDEPTEVWYLFGAWLLAATMNAMLTWWGVSQAIMSNSNLGNGIIPQETVIRVVPIFVAILVWLVRVMIIGTFSVAGERLFSQGERKKEPKITSGQNPTMIPSGNRTMNRTVIPAPTARAATSASTFRPAPKTNSDQVYNNSRAEPTYQDLATGSSINSVPNSNKMNSTQPYNNKTGNTNFR